MKSPPVPISVNWAKYVLYGLFLIGIYFSTYSWLITEDWSRADYSASFLIPLVFLYLLWENRETFLKTGSRPSWTCMWMFMSGILLFWIGELSGEYFSLYLSSWAILVGICWIHMGWNKLKEFGVALLILLAMFPLPHLLYDKLSLQLKLISSWLGVWAMQSLGMSAYREGNMIDLGFTRLQVVDACSGLRYLIPLIVLGVIVAYFFKGARWKKALLVISTVPIAVFVDSLRIASVGVLYPHFGPVVAEGVFHDFSGWLIFMVSFSMLLGLSAVLGRIGRTRAGESVTTGNAPATRDMEEVNAKRLMLNVNSTEPNGGIETNGEGGFSRHLSKAGRELRGPSGPHPASSIQYPESGVQHYGSNIEQADLPSWRQWFMPPQSTLAMVILGITLVLSQGVEFRETIPPRKAFTEFPTIIGPWQGEVRTLQPVIIDELDVSDYILTDYTDRNGRSINMYVAYYASQRKGQSIHSPASCLPGSGWQFDDAGTAVIPFSNPDHPKMVVRRAYLQGGGKRFLSYFWFPMRGRILHNAYQMKLFNLWDALTLKQTHGALVRLITPVYDDERTVDAEQRLQSFSKTMVSRLSEFLP